MALQSVSGIASFDIPSGAYLQDISPSLVEAIYFDLNFLEAVPLGWDMPVDNTVYLWDEDALNSDTVVSSASLTSAATTLTVVANNAHIGDLLVPDLTGAEEVMQITDISSTTYTIVRGINSTTAASYASNVTFIVIDSLQELSDIGSDKSVVPTVRQNNTQIFGTRDLIVSGTQLARRMATRELEDWVGHQLANRAIELRRKLIYAFLLSEPGSSDVGSDSAYRTLKGMRSWARTASGVTDADSEALAMSTSLNPVNKSIVDKGVYVDSLLVGTGLVTSIAGIDANNRRLYESDTAVGYTVQEILLDQGNTVRVIIDSRVPRGQAYLFDKSRVIPKPMNGRGMFSIAATDFTDGRKRRILAEWTMQLKNPEVLGYISNKT